MQSSLNDEIIITETQKIKKQKFKVDPMEEISLDEEYVESQDEGGSSEDEIVGGNKKFLRSAQKPKKIVKIDKPHIIINVSDTQYSIVRFVGKKIFKWVLQNEAEATNWDIFWTDMAVSPEQLGRMQPHQKINHFPGMYSLARKNHLGRNLMKLRRGFPDDYKFFPKTWLLPSEYGDFKMQFQKGKARTFIIKPEASCQGRGIFLTRSIDSINPTDHYVAQRYMHKPFLIDGLKFDLRIYVLLAGSDPMRIYMYKDGLVRFATEPYVAPSNTNLEDMCMHLTNYAINKDNPNFVFNQDKQNMDVGHKRGIEVVFDKLKQDGHDVQKLWNDIDNIIIKTFCTVQPNLSHHYSSCQSDNFANNMCFEILGFDIFLDNKLTPYLIEVNHTPSFTTDTPLDCHIKKNLIKDTLRLMNLNLKTRQEIQAQRYQMLQQRVLISKICKQLTGKKHKYTPEERKEFSMKAQKDRDLYENKYLGGYRKIYPLEDAAQYDKYLALAQKQYEDWTGANIRRNVKKPVIEQQPYIKPAPQRIAKTVPIEKIKKLPILKQDQSDSCKDIYIMNEDDEQPEEKKQIIKSSQQVKKKFFSLEDHQLKTLAVLLDKQKFYKPRQQTQQIVRQHVGNFLMPRLFDIHIQGTRDLVPRAQISSEHKLHLHNSKRI